MHAHTLAPVEASSGDAVSAAWSRVAAFASEVDASLNKWLSDAYRLGLTEYRALTLLSRTSDKELRIAALAQQVGLTSTSTTRLVSRLELKGFARRDVCQDDGRGVFAVIDEPGEKILREVREPYEAHVRELLADPGKHFPHFNADATASALMEVSALVEP